MAKVLVTGIGFITSIGNSKKIVIESLRELKHGVVHFDQFNTPEIPVSLAAPVKDFNTDSNDPEDWTYPSEYKIRRDILRSLSPHGLYAHCAVIQAIKNADLSDDEVSNVDSGLYTASAGSISALYYNLTRMQKLGVQRCSPMGVIASIAGTLNFNLVSAFKIQGSSVGYVSACASSGHALGSAWDEISLGRQKRMIVVGAEDCNLFNILPFASMRAITPSDDPDTASRPFDKDRSGFVGTGGAAAMVLEDAETAEKRGAKVYAEFHSWGQASDGYNVAISHPEGRGLARAMHLALERGELEPKDIDYINAHAPSTPIGDLSEIRAIKKIFKDTRPKISSTKALTGHGLSLSSIMEAGFTSVSIDEGFTPGSAHIDNIDPAAESLNIIHQTDNTGPEIAISNSSGFGGANVALVFRKKR